jgi:ATP-dependent helicase HrpA
VRDEAAYDALESDLARELEPRLRAVVGDVARLLDRWRRVDRTLSGRADLATLPSLTDMRDQLARLVHRGFVSEAGLDRLRRYPVYLGALEQRRRRLDEQPARDREPLARIVDLQQAYLHQVEALPPGRPPSAALRRARWLLEEYRVSLWAQQLGPEKVSDQRVRAALAAAASSAS